MTKSKTKAKTFPSAHEGPWHDLSPYTAALLTERLQDFGVIKASIDRVQGIRAQRLPFYKDHILCDVALDRMPRSRIWLSCLYGPDGVHALTGASVVIHGLNRQLKPDLSYCHCTLINQNRV